MIGWNKDFLFLIKVALHGEGILGEVFLDEAHGQAGP